ncbi:PIG-L deacetylase family protein [Luteibacter yeojuensis]|uniref:PIG-L family deacetylase n=1 Tax=Luteibacter yeojuensis TaxID=345309 RepID=A0A7X5TPJ0_9GAMM|nr:PIG-L family deacetylase [Luteibacter yeojuensis]NID15110.1 PIG-L family deacetylase [Luteibacter yeojuensis]
MPRHPVIDGSTRLLVVAPHPDDESLAAGMLIQRTLAAGGRADVLLLTDGDDNPWPQRWLERRLVVGAEARARWGARRRGEVAAALGRLGLGTDHLHALGWHDMQVTSELRLRHGQALGAIRRVLERARPNLVVIPDLGDSHPDHGSAHVLVRLALAATGSMAEVLTYMVHGTERSAPEDLLVPDLDPERQATKIGAVLEHATQMALSRKRMLRIASRPERFDRPPPAPGTGALRLPWRPGPLARARLRVVLADGQGVAVWPWRKAPLERAGGDWILPLRDTPGPAFVKLTADLSTPWIYDRYGWAGQDPEPVGLVARPVG